MVVKTTAIYIPLRTVLEKQYFVIRDEETKRLRVKETKSQKDKETKRQRDEERKDRFFEPLMFMNLIH